VSANNLRHPLLFGWMGGVGHRVTSGESKGRGRWTEVAGVIGNLWAQVRHKAQSTIQARHNPVEEVKAPAKL